MGHIQIQNICKEFENRRRKPRRKENAGRGGGDHISVLDHINLEFEDGEMVCILGPSGCGKSTLLRIIAGFEAPTTGQVIIDDQPVSGPGPNHIFVFQHSGLLPWMTVYQNVELGQRHIRDITERDATIREYIEMVELDSFENHFPHQLSGGMQRRAELARALSVNPEILIMDEPFSGLDFLTHMKMREEVVNMHQFIGKTTLVVTHDIDDALIMGDRIVVMDDRPATVEMDQRLDFPHPRKFDTDSGLSDIRDELFLMLGVSYAVSLPHMPWFYATTSRLAAAALIWLFGISALHYWLNTNSSQRQVVRMGYMPVVTNLASPLLDHASREGAGIRFHAIKFASFAEMAEALRNDDIHAAFMIAPLSIVLKQQQEKVRVVYIGNRHESTLVVRKNLHARSLKDLRGRTLAIPMRYSGHNLSILLLLEQAGLNGQINIVEMNPPDMPAALATGALDAYYVGEPYAAKSLLNGNASLLYYVEDVWKDFICNLVVVKQDMIDRQPELVQALVHGAVRSGIWAQRHTKKAAAVAAEYWNQPQELVHYALNAPEGRIVYDHYTPHEKELQQIADLMLKFGLTTSNNIRGLVDNRFAKSADLSGITDIASILPSPALAADQNCSPKRVKVAAVTADTHPDAFSN